MEFFSYYEDVSDAESCGHRYTDLSQFASQFLPQKLFFTLQLGQRSKIAFPVLALDLTLAFTLGLALALSSFTVPFGLSLAFARRLEGVGFCSSFASGWGDIRSPFGWL